MKIRSYQLFILSLAFILSSCSLLGIPKPQSFNQELALGFASVTALRNTATALLQAKKISADDAQNVQNQADNLREGLVVARRYEKDDPKTASAKLKAVMAAVTSIQDYLKGKS